MRPRAQSATVCLLGIIYALTACAGHSEIQQPLTTPLRPASRCEIGEIQVSVPTDTKPEDMPGPKHIGSLRFSLQDQLNKEKVFDFAATTLPGSDYVVTGMILEVKGGSILGMFGLGKARAKAELQLTERSTGAILFSGTFEGSASRTQTDPGTFGESHTILGGDVAEGMSFDGLARQFAKALKKAVKSLK